jgi:hypothetical protein
VKPIPYHSLYIAGAETIETPFEPAFPYFLQLLKRCDGSQVDFGMHKATQIDAAPAKFVETSDYHCDFFGRRQKSAPDLAVETGCDHLANK